MLRALLTHGEARTVVLGLGPTNIERLRHGEPIRVNLRHLEPLGEPTDLPDVDVIIAYDVDGTLGEQLMERTQR